MLCLWQSGCTKDLVSYHYMCCPSQIIIKLPENPYRNVLEALNSTWVSHQLGACLLLPL